MTEGVKLRIIASMSKNQSTLSSKPVRPVYLRASRVAAILDISRTSVYDLIKNGELGGIIRVGSRLRIPECAVDELIARRQVV